MSDEAVETSVPSAGRVARGAEKLPAVQRSLGSMLYSRIAVDPEREAFRSPRAGGGWESWSWARSGQRIEELAAGFLSLGLLPEERVAIASTTRLERLWGVMR